MIKFSVVMPLYNKEKYISNTIKSVLSQTYKNFELIIVDDGSTDNSFTIAKSFQDKRITIYKRDNAGASVARNFGISKASGEFIAFIDGDDIWYNDFLETIMKMIYKYPDLKVFGTNIGLKNYNAKDKHYINTSTTEESIVIKDYFYQKIKDDIYLTASSAVVKKEVFNDVGCFQEGLKNWEDLDMWARIALKYDIGFSKRICSVYQQQIEHSASSYNGIINSDFFDNPEKYISKYEIKGEKLYYMREYIAMWKISYSRMRHSATNNKKESLRLLKKYKYTELFKKEFYSAYIYIYTPLFIRKLFKKIKKCIST